jgi:hypothetical protein
MGKEEVGQLLAILHEVEPKLCLEWGSGGSTRALLEVRPPIERLVSIEHNREWYDRVAAALRDPRLELHYLPPAEPAPPRTLRNRRMQAWDARAEHEPALLADYVAFPATLGIRFDFVLVDGRARRFCLRAGWDLLRPGGVLLLHDAQRTDYHDVLFSLGPRPHLLEPWRRGQLALLSKPESYQATP